jgi:hypothetical protein
VSNGGNQIYSLSGRRSDRGRGAEERSGTTSALALNSINYSTRLVSRQARRLREHDRRRLQLSLQQQTKVVDDSRQKKDLCFAKMKDLEYQIEVNTNHLKERTKVKTNLKEVFGKTFALWGINFNCKPDTNPSLPRPYFT